MLLILCKLQGINASNNCYINISSNSHFDISWFKTYQSSNLTLKFPLFNLAFRELSSLFVWNSNISWLFNHMPNMQRMHTSNTLWVIVNLLVGWQMGMWEMQVFCGIWGKRCEMWILPQYERYYEAVFVWECQNMGKSTFYLVASWMRNLGLSFHFLHIKQKINSLPINSKKRIHTFLASFAF